VTHADDVDMTSVLRPTALRAGDTVAVAALSSGLQEYDRPAHEQAVR
jgi:hypothetical protein